MKWNLNVDKWKKQQQQKTAEGLCYEFSWKKNVIFTSCKLDQKLKKEVEFDWGAGTHVNKGLRTLITVQNQISFLTLRE